MVRIVFGMDELLLTLGFLLQALCVIWIIFYIRNKRESEREVALSDELIEEENDIIVTGATAQTIVRSNHNIYGWPDDERDYFIPLRETKKNFLPKKDIKSHTLVERKQTLVRPDVYTIDTRLNIGDVNIYDDFFRDRRRYNE